MRVIVVSLLMALFLSGPVNADTSSKRELHSVENFQKDGFRIAAIVGIPFDRYLHLDAALRGTHEVFLVRNRRFVICVYGNVAEGHAGVSNGTSLYFNGCNEMKDTKRNKTFLNYLGDGYRIEKIVYRKWLGKKKRYFWGIREIFLTRNDDLVMCAVGTAAVRPKHVVETLGCGPLADTESNRWFRSYLKNGFRIVSIIPGKMRYGSKGRVHDIYLAKGNRYVMCSAGVYTDHRLNFGTCEALK